MAKLPCREGNEFYSNFQIANISDLLAPRTDHFFLNKGFVYVRYYVKIGKNSFTIFALSSFLFHYIFIYSYTYIHEARIIQI